VTTDRALCATLIRQVGDLWCSTDHKDREQAKRHCHTCPIMTSCRSQALADPTTRGVWGGMTDRERALYRGDTEPADLDDTPADPATPEGRKLAKRRALLERHHAAGGTAAGASLHRRLGERPCESCGRAENAGRLANKTARRRRAGLSPVTGSGGSPVPSAGVAEPQGAAA
jgi:hypothetical protein